MAALRDQLNQPEYINWMKGGLALKYMNDGLVNFLEKEVGALQHHICSIVRMNLPAGAQKHCSSCSIVSSKRRNWICPKGICHKIYKLLKRKHLYGKVVLENTNINAWTDTSRSWEIGKCFMPTGYENKQSATETDCAGLLALAINCLPISKKFDVSITQPIHKIRKIREMRNKIMHSENLSLKQEDLDDLIKDIKCVLQDPQILLDCQEAKDAVNRISEVEREDFNVMCGDSIEHLHAYVRQLGIRQSQHEDQIKQFLKDCKTKIKNEVTHSTENELGKLRNDLNQSNPRLEITTFQIQLRRLEETVENIDRRVNERDKILSIRNEIDIVRSENETMRYLIDEHHTHLETIDKQISHIDKAVDELKLETTVTARMRLPCDKKKRKPIEQKIENARGFIELNKIYMVNNIETRALLEAEKRLQSEKCVILSGISGSGKTHTAFVILDKMLNCNPELEPLIVHEAKDFETVMRSPKHKIVLIDDFLGRINVKELNLWNEYMNAIESFIKSNNSFLIITLSNTIMKTYDGEKVCGLFKEERIVDATELSTDEKSKILERYAIKGIESISKTDKKAIISIPIHGIGFPFLIKISAKKNFTDLIKHQFESLSSYIKHLETTDVPSFVALVMTLFCGKTLPRYSLSCDHIGCFTQLQVHYAGAMLDESALFKGAKYMSDILLKEDEARYVYISDVVFEATFAVAMELIPFILISYCPIQYLVNLGKQSQYMSDMHYEQIIKRFARDSRYYCIAESVLWEEHNFVSMAMRNTDTHAFYQTDESGKSMFIYFAKFGFLHPIKELISITEQNATVVPETQIRIAIEEACLAGKLECVTYLIEKAKSSITFEMVYNAVNGGNFEIFKVLENEVEKSRAFALFANRERNTGFTILHIAAMSGYLEILKHICQRYKHLLNVLTKEKISAIHLAAISGHCECLIYLLQGINRNTVEEHGKTILHLAAAEGHLNIVRYICHWFKDTVIFVDDLGMNAAHVAAENGKIECLKHLIANGINAMSVEHSGETILHIAAYEGHFHIVKYICENHHWLINKTNVRHANAAHFASENGHLKCLVYLIEHGTDPFSKLQNGQTLLHIVSSHGQNNIVNYLCETYKQLLFETDDKGQNAGHLAAATGNIDCLKDLIKQGLRPATRSKLGMTLLHKACCFGKIDVVKYLCENYEYLLPLTDDKLRTAGNISAEKGWSNCVLYLKEKQIDVRNIRLLRTFKMVCKWSAMAFVLLVAHLLNNERTGRGPMRLI